MTPSASNRHGYLQLFTTMPGDGMALQNPARDASRVTAAHSIKHARLSDQQLLDMPRAPLSNLGLVAANSPADIILTRGPTGTRWNAASVAQRLLRQHEFDALNWILLRKNKRLMITDLAACTPMQEWLSTDPPLNQLVFVLNRPQNSQIELLASALGCARLVEKIAFFSCALHQEHLQWLAPALAHCHSLQSLKLQSCTLDSDGLHTLAQALANMPRLTRLVISRSGLGGNVNVTPLFDGLSRNNSITHLNLSANALHGEGAAALCAMLKKKPSLESLDIRRNSLDESDAKALAESMGHHPRLRKLNISDNRIGAGIIDIVEASGTCPGLEEIPAERNELEVSHLPGLAASLANNATLQRLLIDWREIADVHDSDLVKLSLRLRSNETLVDLQLGSMPIDNTGVADEWARTRLMLPARRKVFEPKAPGNADRMGQPGTLFAQQTYIDTVGGQQGFAAIAAILEQNRARQPLKKIAAFLDLHTRANGAVPGDIHSGIASNYRMVVGSRTFAHIDALMSSASAPVDDSTAEH